MEKNNKGLLITLIVLLSIIALLLSGIFTFALISGTTSISTLIPKKTQTIFDQSYNAEEIKNITIDSDAGDITIKNSNDGKIRLTANGINSDSFDAEADRNTLKISSSRLNKMNFFGWAQRYIGPDIVIYVPTVMDSVSITSNMGNVEIEDELVTSLTVDNDMGNIEAKKLGGSFDLNTNMGNIEIERINITANSKATTNMGDIDIEKTNEVNIYAKTSMGDSDVKDNTPTASVMLTAETDMGSIEIND